MKRFSMEMQIAALSNAIEQIECDMDGSTNEEWNELMQRDIEILNTMRKRLIRKKERILVRKALKKLRR